MIKNSSTIPYKCTVIQLSMSEQGKGIKVLHHTFDQKNGIGKKMRNKVHCTDDIVYYTPTM